MNSITSRCPSLFSFQSIVLLMALNSVLPTIASAQDLDNVTISGRVMDQNGAAVPGAEVISILTQTAARRTTKSDDEGRYRLIQLTPGSYLVRALSPGFARQEKRDLKLVAGQNAQLEIILYPEGVVADPVLIIAVDAAPIDTTRTVVGGTVETREVESLPVANRSPLDLIFTLPGVTEEPLSTRELAEDRNTTHAATPEEAGTFALSGGPAYSNNITIDGLDNNDDRAARERFQPSLDAVEEVQIITNQFSAEYGRASGGRINIRTRGGSRQFRGRGFYFFRDESLHANPTGLKQTGEGNTY